MTGSKDVERSMVNTESANALEANGTPTPPGPDASAARVHRLIGELLSFTADVDQAYEAEVRCPQMDELVTHEMHSEDTDSV